jgi:hypothetical protein
MSSALVSPKRTTTGDLPPSELDLPHALTYLKEHLDLSWRQIVEATKAHDPAGKGYSLGYINRIGTGDAVPVKPEYMLAFCLDIAESLGVDPMYFREYRELIAAEEAKRLTREVGLDAVLKALGKLHS